jgi:hypothetical protein
MMEGPARANKARVADQSNLRTRGKQENPRYWAVNLPRFGRMGFLVGEQRCLRGRFRPKLVTNVQTEGNAAPFFQTPFALKGANTKILIKLSADAAVFKTQ